MKCPYCLWPKMDDAPDLGKGWFKCPSCGATWIEMPQLKQWPKKVKK